MALPKNILVPVDFGDASDAAVAYAVDLAETTGAKLVLLHAFEIPIVGVPDGVVAVTAELTSRIVEAAEKALGALVARYEGRGVTITARLEQGDARDVILTQASKVGADLIIIGTHGRRGIARALIGSVAERIVRTAPIPVLTIHAHEAPPAG